MNCSWPGIETRRCISDMGMICTGLQMQKGPAYVEDDF